jgi:hypothetical protein
VGIALAGTTGPVEPWAASFARAAAANGGNFMFVSGQHETVAASDTVDLSASLSLVAGVIAVMDDDPVDGAMQASASIGDQAGTPAAGKILIKTWKSTDGDATQIAATTFSLKVNYLAWGTPVTPVQ